MQEPRPSYFDDVEPAIDPARLALGSKLEEAVDWSAAPPAYLSTDQAVHVGKKPLGPSL
jgi:hypothetical protein